MRNPSKSNENMIDTVCNRKIGSYAVESLDITEQAL